MWATALGVLTSAFSFVKGMFKWMNKSDVQKAARAEGENKWLKKTLEEVDKSNEADRNFNNDPRYRDWLRTKYKRKD